MSESTELVAGKYAVFNKERVAQYKLVIATGIRSSLDGMRNRLNDIIEALEEEEPRSTRAKRKQKATPKRR